MKELDNQQKGSKDAAKQAAIAAKADDARAELVRLEAVVDGLMSDEAAAEASSKITMFCWAKNANSSWISFVLVKRREKDKLMSKVHAKRRSMRLTWLSPL